MTLYGFVLFVHVVFAIALVGGSIWSHLAVGLAHRTTQVAGLRSLIAWTHGFVKASGPIAGVVLLAGVYLAFDGSWWGRGWPVVSLVLFAFGGVAATAIVDPKITAVRDRLEDVPDGPVTDDVRGLLADRTLTMVSWALAGADLAIVYLMTNKPGWGGSLAAGVACMALGTAVGLRELRQAPRVIAPAAPAA